MALLKVIPVANAFEGLLALGEALEGRTTVFFSDRPYTDKVEAKDGEALWVESSGSTGTPKLIRLSAKALLASAKATEKALGGPGQWLLALPINYIAGAQVLVRSLLADTQPILTNTALPFTAENFARAASLMTGERRYTSLVPTQLQRLGEAAGSNDFVLEQLRRFDAILLGGQSPNLKLVEMFRLAGVNIVVTYGSTETAGGCVYDGVPLEGVGVSLDNDGRIEITGPTLANGLDGLWQSNDLGEFDSEGKLVVLGRTDRVINSGGIKLALDRVEDWVRSHRGVLDVVVSPITNLQFGESFVSWVVYADPEFTIDPDQAIGAFGIAAKPAVWASLEYIPRLSNGKPDHQKLATYFQEMQEDLRKQNGQEDQ